MSVTQQQKINDTLYTIKMEVPFQKITKVYIDIYTVLSCNYTDATIYKTEVASGKTEVYKTQDWNVGIPLYEGEERTAALQKLLETMYYKAIQKPATKEEQGLIDKTKQIIRNYIKKPDGTIGRMSGHGVRG